MGKSKAKDERFQSARDIFREGDFEPLRELIRIYKTSVIVSEEESRHPGVQAMLGNYDLVPNGDGRWRLELNVGRRIEIAKSCAPYLHSQLRSSESKQTGEDLQITWVLKTFSDENKPGPMRLVAAPASEPLQLHPGDVVNQS